MLRGADPEDDGIATVAERIRSLAEALVAERLERRVVEALGLRDIPDPDRYVIDHRSCSLVCRPNHLDGSDASAGLLGCQPSRWLELSRIATTNERGCGSG